MTKKKDTPLPPSALEEILDRDAAERRHRAAAERIEKDPALRHAIDARNELVQEDDKARLGLDKRDAEALLAAVEREALPVRASPAGVTPAAPRAKTTQPRILTQELGSAGHVEGAQEGGRRSPVLLGLGLLAAAALVGAIVLAIRRETPAETSAPSASTPAPVAERVTPPPTSSTTVPAPGSSSPEPPASAVPTVSVPPRPSVVPTADTAPKPSSRPTGDPEFDPEGWKFKKNK